jgi:hypothetical protein
MIIPTTALCGSLKETTRDPKTNLETRAKADCIGRAQARRNRRTGSVRRAVSGFPQREIDRIGPIHLVWMERQDGKLASPRPARSCPHPPCVDDSQRCRARRPPPDAWIHTKRREMTCHSKGELKMVGSCSTGPCRFPRERRCASSPCRKLKPRPPRHQLSRTTWEHGRRDPRLAGGPCDQPRSLPLRNAQEAMKAVFADLTATVP